MINIYSNPKVDVDEICEKHWVGLKIKLLARIDTYLLRVYLKKEIFDFLTVNLEKIIISKPTQLLELHDQLDSIIVSGTISQIKRIKKQVSKIFSYKWFASKKKSYCAFHLSESLDVRVCPYCNINFTLTIINSRNSKIARPSFDHFFSKSEFPLLAISFFNLIPSCNVCNSDLKGSLKFTLDDYFHPYLHNIESEIRFDYNPKSYSSIYGFDDNFDITIKPESGSVNSKRIKNHIKAFKLEDIYQYHKGYAAEVITKNYSSGGSYLNSLRGAFPHLSLTSSEFYRFTYGNYVDDEDLGKRAMSKMTRDLVKKLDKGF